MRAARGSQLHWTTVELQPRATATRDTQLDPNPADCSGFDRSAAATTTTRETFWRLDCLLGICRARFCAEITTTGTRQIDGTTEHARTRVPPAVCTVPFCQLCALAPPICPSPCEQRSRLDVAGDGSLSCSEPCASSPPVPNSPMSPDRMMIIGLLLNVFSHGSVPVSASLDCLVAEQGCIQEHSCMVLYRLLEYCAAEEAVSPLGPDARLECLEAQNALQQYRPLQVCKCQRGSRREEHCLRVYWTVRFAAYDEYEVSPYEELELNLVRNIEMSRMASIMAASTLSVDGQNQCLKAAQDCGLYEKCGSLRSEYVVACTKRAAVSENNCNRQKCHKALRRFLERVPEEYSFALLFCPCSDTLCGERRRKTIVPSCSYEENVKGEERAGKPNCLSLQNYCSRDELCRSRFADFQHNCQPSPLSASGCTRESRAMCLKAYAGLIGTIMTPNYVSNSSTEVSQWCTCDGSGNEWQGCQRILHMFSNNICLRNAISSMGIFAPPAVENTPVPASQPSSRVYQEIVHVSVNTLPEFTSMDESEGVEQEEEESEEFNIIPPYSEKDSNIESRARGSQRGASSRAVPVFPLLLLPTLVLDWKCWGY